MSQREYDAKQTALIDKIGEHLNSVAILVIQAKEMDPASDNFGEQLSLINHDVMHMIDYHTRLNIDDITCEKCGGHLLKHDDEVCDSMETAL